MTETTNPLWIGITARHGDQAWVQNNTRHYIKVVEEYGAIPVLLSPDCPAILPDGSSVQPDAAGRLPERILDQLQGLILAGGGDVHPKYFGQPLAGAEAESIDLKRDELELTLSQQALTRDLPIFAICRGCQVLNVAAGGGMVQHFMGHRSPKESTAFHDVLIAPDSRFHAIVSAPRLPVNTFHHQGMDVASMAPTFTPVALAQPDAWLVEAYESRQHSWVIGVQWHPERAFELDVRHRRLWDSFVEACKAKQASPENCR